MLSNEYLNFSKRCLRLSKAEQPERKTNSKSTLRGPQRTIKAMPEALEGGAAHYFRNKTESLRLIF